MFPHALDFILGGCFLAFALVSPSFSLPVCVCFFSFGHVLSCSAWPVLRGGLAALYLVSQLSVWSRGALLRRLSQCLCEYELVCILSRVLHLVSHVPLPLRSKHRGTLRLSVIDLAPRGGGRDGCICRGGRITCQLRQLGPPLCGLPIVCPPRGLLARVS